MTPWFRGVQIRLKGGKTRMLTKRNIPRTQKDTRWGVKILQGVSRGVVVPTDQDVLAIWALLFLKIRSLRLYKLIICYLLRPLRRGDPSTSMSMLYAYAGRITISICNIHTQFKRQISLSNLCEISWQELCMRNIVLNPIKSVPFILSCQAKHSN